VQLRESWPTVEQLVSLPKEDIGNIDPVVMDLAVARGIPALADLDIGRYVRLADEWADDLRGRIPAMDAHFRRSPDRWKSDIDFFHLGLVCWYADVVLGVAYREDQRNATSVVYTDPTDLFLNGVMDTRRGTCGNLAMLHVVLGRRIGLPVSLACAGSHFLCRFDDGIKTINIEATETGRGGFASESDEYYMKEYHIPQRGVDCGSDLCAVAPRELLGLLVGLRARHLENANRMTQAEADYLLARYLFPRNRQLYTNQSRISVLCGMKLFESGERGHPAELAQEVRQVVGIGPSTRKPIDKPTQIFRQPKEKTNGSHVDAIFEQVFVSGDIL
jgi:hypothetical protein